MKLCGLTGGIGMGKSTAADFFRTHGAQVVDTDVLARQLVQPGESALVQIQDLFGKDVITQDGHLRRDVLAQIVFSDSAARQKLEAILHPRIRAAWQAQVAVWQKENYPLVVVVIPLLFETQAETYFNKIICVACSSGSQRTRLQARGWSAEQVSRRIDAQWPVDQKMARSHFVVWTEGTLTVHEEQILRVMERL